MITSTIGLLGQKIGMSQLFNEKGKLIPITILRGGPCIITYLKSEAKEGYNAVQLGYFQIAQPKRGKFTKSEAGHCSKHCLPIVKHLREFVVQSKEELSTYQIGDNVGLDQFEKNSFLSISSVSTGKGNLGNIKRHHFNRGAMTHGSKHHRLQGSMGSGTTPGRVFPGKRMPGKEGNKKITIKNLELLLIDKEKNLLVVKGSIPGKYGNLLSIQKA